VETFGCNSHDVWKNVLETNVAPLGNALLGREVTYKLPF